MEKANSSDQALVDAPSEPEDDAASEPIDDAPSESDSEPIDDEEPVDVIVKNQVAVTSEAVKRARRRLRGKGASMDEDERFEFMISVIAVFVVTVFCLVPGFISMVLTMVIGVPVYLAYTFATSRVGMLLIAGAAGWFLALRHRPAGLKKKSVNLFTKELNQTLSLFGSPSAVRLLTNADGGISLSASSTPTSASAAITCSS